MITPLVRVARTLKMCRLKKNKNEMGDLLVNMVREAENEVAAALEQAAKDITDENAKFKEALEDIANGSGKKAGLTVFLTAAEMQARAKKALGEENANPPARLTPS